eukprot:SAG31_NODE_7954_length_1555_cov_2.806319_1_plen_154_part_00
MLAVLYVLSRCGGFRDYSARRPGASRWLSGEGRARVARGDTACLTCLIATYKQQSQLPIAECPALLFATTRNFAHARRLRSGVDCNPTSYCCTRGWHLRGVPACPNPYFTRPSSHGALLRAHAGPGSRRLARRGTVDIREKGTLFRLQAYRYS